VKQKSEAQVFLEQPEKLDAIIENKLIEKQQWHELALGITANMGGERVQSSGSKSRMSDAVERWIDVEAEIDAAVDKLISVRQSVVELIEQLDSPMEYRLLHDRLLNHGLLPRGVGHFGHRVGVVHAGGKHASHRCCGYGGELNRVFHGRQKAFLTT
jgi:hypothetical protein